MSVTEPNQVNTFLRQHGGPGIQHIGLHTDRLVDCVGYLKRAGINFLQPPPTYYEEVNAAALLDLSLFDSDCTNTF